MSDIAIDPLYMKVWHTEFGSEKFCNYVFEGSPEQSAEDFAGDMWEDGEGEHETLVSVRDIDGVLHNFKVVAKVDVKLTVEKV